MELHHKDDFWTGRPDHQGDALEDNLAVGIAGIGPLPDRVMLLNGQSPTATP